MILLMLLIATNFDIVFGGSYAYDDDENTLGSSTKKPVDFEPALPPRMTDEEKLEYMKKIDCEAFSEYARNCTLMSALMYNSSKKSPPMPAKMHDWCRAIRHLTNCAVDWNSECKDVTESHFNEESIKGHMHVLNSICDDEWFLSHYDKSPQCIDISANSWEICYATFKNIVDEQKNATPEWTHYDTHFQLCCARTQFRKCTLDLLFMIPESKCDQDQALILQKFSVIVSEGDVFQDCEHNMMYKNCPGGDPRPPTAVLSKLMNAESVQRKNIASELSRHLYTSLVILIALLNVLI